MLRTHGIDIVWSAQSEILAAEILPDRSRPSLVVDPGEDPPAGHFTTLDPALGVEDFSFHEETVGVEEFWSGWAICEFPLSGRRISHPTRTRIRMTTRAPRTARTGPPPGREGPSPVWRRGLSGA